MRLRISVLSDGRIAFRNTLVAVDDLAELITAAAEEGAEKKIYLAADPRARNRDVELVLDQVGITRISRVAILTN